MTLGGTWVLFMVLEFTSIEDCQHIRTLLLPLDHMGLSYQCELDKDSTVFWLDHHQRHRQYVKIPLYRPRSIEGGP